MTVRPETRAAFQADPGDPRHGTENGYNNLRCRCDACKSGHAATYRQYRQNWGLADRFRDRYRTAREAGYSPQEAQQRRFRSDPLAP